MSLEKAILGCLLGTAIGDAIGLSYEGISKQRQHKMFKEISGGFFLGKNMVSDDTEHTCMVAQSLIVSAGEVEKFRHSLAWRLRFWFLAIPAGVGFATLRSLIKLWLGFSPKKSGVFSAGNGPAMRSAIIGVCYGNDAKKMQELVQASTRITHTDPKAEYGALAVAVAAYMAATQEQIKSQEYYQRLEKLVYKENEFLELMQKTIAKESLSVEEFAVELGQEKGISGYIYHTLPLVIHCWLKYPKDYSTAIVEIIRCGGDTDTTAAILGAIIGASVGQEGIEQKWQKSLWEWPRSLNWQTKLAQRLAQTVQTGQEQKELPLSKLGIILRNIFFLLVVLTHGLRRLFPPY